MSVRIPKSNFELPVCSTKVPRPWVRLKWRVTNTDLFCFNSHFHPALKEPSKAQLCRNIGYFINQISDAEAPVILLGDLNIHDTDSKGIQIIRETDNMSDPWTDTGTTQRYTWNNWFRPKWSNDNGAIPVNC